MKNADQPIDAIFYTNSEGITEYDINSGLTKREYFAGLAMQGLIANERTQLACIKDAANMKRTPEEELVTYAIGYADELLKQLEKCTPYSPR